MFSSGSFLAVPENIWIGVCSRAAVVSGLWAEPVKDSWQLLLPKNFCFVLSLERDNVEITATIRVLQCTCDCIKLPYIVSDLWPI